MASTRMKNLKRNYCLETTQNNNQSEYKLYKYKKIPTESVMPGLGINVGNMGGAYYHNVLSNNTCSIESELFGIGSSNLVKEKAKVRPQLNQLDDKSFFKLPNVYLPNPLAVEKNQRPKGPFC